MVEVAKYMPVGGGGGGTLISDLTAHFSFLRTKRTVAFAYVFMFSFIALAVFFAFSPSSNSASPYIFTTSSSSISSTAFPSDESHGSHFSSIFSYFLPNSSQVAHNSTSLRLPTNITRSRNSTFEPLDLNKESSSSKNQTQNEVLNDKVEVLKANHSTTAAPKFPATLNHTENTASISSSVLNEEPSTGNNQTQIKELHDQVGVLKPNRSRTGAPNSPVVANAVVNSPLGPSSVGKNITGNGDKRIAEKGVINNFTSSLPSKQSNGTKEGSSANQGNVILVTSLRNCDLYDGNWVRDDTYPLYKPGSCSLIDEQFNCFLNGRPDNGYCKLKWKPNGCTLPRLNGSHMLEQLRGKRLVFVGDSLNRNMWESLVCILRNAVKDQRKVYEASGRHHFRAETSYSFVFEDYKCSVEFFVAPFLVQEWEMADKNGTKKETLRLDLVEGLAEKYKSADIIIFNTGHWWTHDKTSKGQDYYQEGSHVYAELNVLEAFRKALTTWGRWIDANINPMKTLVFFRGYSATHFSGGQWNSGGQCHNETEPITNERYLTPYPQKMAVLESVLKGLKIHVSYMNITRLTDFRKDGHPSVYRKQNLSEEERRSPLRLQDCSHWCLPGVPDAWNELLYAELLRKIN